MRFLRKLVKTGHNELNAQSEIIQCSHKNTYLHMFPVLHCQRIHLVDHEYLDGRKKIRISEVTVSKRAISIWYTRL